VQLRPIWYISRCEERRCIGPEAEKIKLNSSWRRPGKRRMSPYEKHR
jgi:hypothetical protein